MIRPRTSASCLALVALATVAASGVQADEYGPPVDRIPATPIADRCAQYGQGFVDVGNGVCGRVSRHVRVYVGAGNPVTRSLNGFAANGPATAAMRSESMVPGGEVTHLRVRGSLDSYNPFR